MKTRSATTRRQFLALLVAAGLAAGYGAARLRPWRLLVERDRPRSAGARLVSLLGNRESARAVGREYLRVVPAEASVPRLVDGIAAGLPGGRRQILAAGDGELRAALSDRTRQDFAAERTVELRGWILSVTEARLCALAALA